MRQVHVHMEEKLIEDMDDLIREALYPNRAELIRLAVKDLLLKHGSFDSVKEDFQNEKSEETQKGKTQTPP